MIVIKNIKFGLIIFLLLASSKMMSSAKDSILLVSKTHLSAMGAYLSSDSKNSLFLNWSEEIDTSKTNILKYKMFDVKTNRFGKEFVIPSSKGMQSHHESMSKIGKTLDGTLYAIFRFATPNPKSRFAGSIYYAFSKDDGINWSQKIKLVDNVNAVSQSFYDLALLPNGELGITWLDSRKLKTKVEGSTLYFATTKNGNGFQNNKSIAYSTCQCCRTDIYIENEENIHIAFRNITEGSIRDMYSVTSKDNGTTFSNPKIMGLDDWKIDGCPHTGPSLSGNSKELAVVWFTGAKGGSGIFYKKLTDETSFLENKMLISEFGKHPQMITLDNGDSYIVFEEFYLLEEKPYSAIILQSLNNDGTKKEIKISQPNTTNDHAVIGKLNENSILISWTHTVNGRSQIVYKTIDL
jgi:hypothetical protein